MGGALSGARRNGSGSLYVVLYHHVTDRAGELVDELRVSTPPAVFESHLERFGRRYEVVDLEQVLSGRLPRRALLITFDDGYRSVLEVAQPLLQRYGFPSVFFISGAFVRAGSLPLDNLLCSLSHRVPPRELDAAVTGGHAAGRSLGELIGFVGQLPYERQTKLGDELAERFDVDRARLRAESALFLEQTELRRLAELGVEIGNHTRSHVHCRAITDETAADAELVDHRRQLEEWTGAAVRAFSYPYGSADDATPFVERALAAAGHRATFLADSRPNRRGHRGTTWHRVDVRDEPASKLYLDLAILPPLRAVRDRLRGAAAGR